MSHPRPFSATPGRSSAIPGDPRLSPGGFRKPRPSSAIPAVLDDLQLSRAIPGYPPTVSASPGVLGDPGRRPWAIPGPSWAIPAVSGQGAKFLSPAAHVFWFTLVFQRFILSD
jgi:hypothetical protein